MNAVPVQWIGGDMTASNDREFDRLQEWFTPRRLRKILREWYARYEPWAYHHPDEQSVRPLMRKHDAYDAPETNRALTAGEVQKLLNQLMMHRPDLYDVIIGFYLDVEPKQDPKRPHVIYWQPRMTVFEIADWQGCSPRTIYRREEEARHWMAKRSGWEPPVESREV